MVFDGLVVVLLFVFVSRSCLMCAMDVVYVVMSCVLVVALLCFVWLC